MAVFDVTSVATFKAFVQSLEKERFVSPATLASLTIQATGDVWPHLVFMRNSPGVSVRAPIQEVFMLADKLRLIID